MSRKQDARVRLWGTSLDRYARAAGAAAEAWARNQQENERLKWRLELLQRAYEASRAERERLAADNKYLREKNSQLQNELRKSQETVDIIASGDNAGMIQQLFPVLEGKADYE